MKFNRKWARALHLVSMAAGAAAVSSILEPESAIHQVLGTRDAAAVVLVAQVAQSILGELQNRRNPDGSRAELPYVQRRPRGGE